VQKQKPEENSSGFFLDRGGCFDLSICDLARDHVPEPNRKDSVVNNDHACAHREGAGRLSKAGIFPPPVARAENNHQHGKESEN
jgi:hypothetical protein